ncbi:unnamed protein product [Bursaphelenchus okinawaensis]|uniref:Apple domain-containing protein n=1 Tax=Bursaphelenchus okinawaensis TaxID=465554 RepID=A0A811KJJ5_9BILA|nr:unnamed protein product [Bursaphelenchus okinawaensis]CAG9105041.1 unnamed protein product [Bursaphelenchus okinawaensis]
METKMVILLVLLSSPICCRAAMSNCFFLPNIALNGGTYDEIDTHDLNVCCIVCARDPCCIAYTFDRFKNRCYLKRPSQIRPKPPLSPAESRPMNSKDKLAFFAISKCTEERRPPLSYPITKIACSIVLRTVCHHTLRRWLVVEKPTGNVLVCHASHH